MPKFTNFFETLKEAHIRLRSTVVLYDNEPYYVHAITDHKKDGIFRIYMEPIGWDVATRRYPPAVENIPADHPGLGGAIDEWLDKNPTSTTVRKMMNSPLFNKFRPFPIGMVNQGMNTYYVERSPQRSTNQGLNRSMLQETLLTAASRNKMLDGNGNVNIFSPAFKAAILADHPSAKDCLENLKDPDIQNESAAFHRLFAFVRGPCRMIFLAYKGDLIGYLPKRNFEYLVLGDEYAYCREVVEKLQLFGQIS